MKFSKHIIVVILFSVFVSCGSSKIVKESRKTLKGNWTLTEVTYDRPGTYNVNLFNDASEECMEGSSWRFIPNNNFGNYTLSGINCDSETRYFVWSVDESEGNQTNYDILVKPTDAKMKSATNAGFRVNLAYLSEEQLQMTQTVNVEGVPFKITMNFIKAF